MPRDSFTPPVAASVRFGHDRWVNRRYGMSYGLSHLVLHSITLALRPTGGWINFEEDALGLGVTPQMIRQCNREHCRLSLWGWAQTKDTTELVPEEHLRNVHGGRGVRLTREGMDLVEMPNLRFPVSIAYLTGSPVRHYNHTTTTLVEAVGGQDSFNRIMQTLRELR